MEYYIKEFGWIVSLMLDVVKVGKSVSLIRAFGASPDLSSKHVVCSLAASDPQKMAKDGFKYVHLYWGK